MKKKRVPVTAERIAELRRMPYALYLKSPEWLRHRQVALKVYDYRCQICSGTDELNVHHRTYERLGCERITDLQVLCRTCHALYHMHQRLECSCPVCRSQDVFNE